MWHLFTKANFRLFLCILPSALLVIVQGGCMGWSTIAIVKLQEDVDFLLPLSQVTVISTAFELGRLVTAMPAGMLIDMIGRKPVICISAGMQVVCWILLSITTSLCMVYGIRFILGVCAVLGTGVAFTHAAEICPSKIRGTVLCIIDTHYFLGVVLQYLLGAFLSYRLTNIVTTIFAIMIAGLTYFTIETPQYLLSKKQDKKAKINYTYLHPHYSDITLSAKFEKLKHFVDGNRITKEDSKSVFADPVNRKSMLLAFVIDVLTQFTGFPAVLLFVHTVFQRISHKSVYTFTIAFAVLEYAGSLSGAFVSDLIGRRKMYFISCVFCVISHICTAAICYVDQIQPNEYVPWMLLCSLSSYAIIYASSIGMLTVVIRGEILPQNVKGIGNGFCGMSSGISCGLAVMMFQLVDQHVGLMYNFLIFVVTSLCLLGFVYAKLPETKHKTLDEIQAALAEG